jgi:hypothetical protein
MINAKRVLENVHEIPIVHTFVQCQRAASSTATKKLYSGEKPERQKMERPIGCIYIVQEAAVTTGCSGPPGLTEADLVVDHSMGSDTQRTPDLVRPVPRWLFAMRPTYEAPLRSDATHSFR